MNNQLKKSILLASFLFIYFFTQAQDNLDSLWSVWHDETATDSKRAHAMHDIAKYGYLYSQPDSANYYAKLSYDFAKVMDLKKEMASALCIQGVSYYVRGDFDKAKEYYLRSLIISEEISDMEGMGKTLNNIGVIYSNQGDFSQSMEYQASKYSF